MKTFWLWIALAILALVASSASTKPEPCDENCAACPYSSLEADLSTLPCSAASAPAVDIPPALRTQNWGGGSCVHASTVHLLHWQGQHELAEW
jgi:hypothetical protein